MSTAEFQRGMDFLEDEPCPERPVTTVSREIIQRISDMVMADRRMTQRHIASFSSYFPGEFIPLSQIQWQ